MFTVLALGLGVTAAASYLLGLWDRPKFSTAQLLENSSENNGNNDNQNDDNENDYTNNNKRAWFAIVAISKEKNIGKHIMKLIDATQKGIESLSNGSELLREGCKAYLWRDESDDKENMPDSLSIGLFFDDPSKVEHPRWAVGWVVRGVSSSGDDLTLNELQAMVAEQVQKNSGLDKDNNEIRVVRLAGETPIFRAKIPWRTIAPMLHWERGFQDFEKGGYKCESEEGPVAIAFYVEKKKSFTSHIDYVIAYGDNCDIWKDAFP